MTPPKVTVIVPVYNCGGTVATALRSALDQSLAPELVEVIAVDDGSTDGGAAEMERLALADPRLTVLRRPGSGGPGRPRNTGMARARGEYVFFLDADDRLGPEALERMCAAADAHSTDVVIGNYVGVGRGAARFAENIANVTVDDTDVDVYGRSLTAHKLFRREMLERHRLRFPEGLVSGEDKVFAAHALLHASGISVVADYDCYYLVAREDGTSIMQTGGAPPEEYYAHAARPLLEQVVTHRDPGPVRDRMLVRHFRRDVLHRFDAGFRTAPDDVRQRTVEAAGALCRDFLTDAVMMRMPPKYRLLAHCARHGHADLIDAIIEADGGDDPMPVVVDSGRALVRYPGLGDASPAIPDACFDVTDRLALRRVLTALDWDGDALRVGGTAEVDRLPADGRTVTLLLLSKKSGGEHRFPLDADRDADRDAGGAVAVDVASLPVGTWDLHVEVAHGGLVKRGRLGADRLPHVTVPEARFVAAGTAVTPFFTSEHGNLSLTVRPGIAGLRRLLRFDGAEWGEDGRLRVLGHLPATPGAAAGVRLDVALDHRAKGATRVGGVRREQDGDRLDFTALLDVRGLAAGRWDVWLEVATGAERARVRVPMDAAARSSAVPCAALGMRNAAYYRTASGNLSVEVLPGRVPALARSARQRLSQLHRR